MVTVVKYALTTPMTNKLAFILNKKRICLRDRPPAQPREGLKSEIGIECVVHGHGWIDIDDNLACTMAVKANDIRLIRA